MIKEILILNLLFPPSSAGYHKIRYSDETKLSPINKVESYIGHDFMIKEILIPIQDFLLVFLFVFLLADSNSSSSFSSVCQSPGFSSAISSVY
jgi:hypothetical protein